MKKTIPLSIPYFNGNEKKYLLDCIDTGFISSVGPYVDRFENMMADYLGCKGSVATMNGTSALHLALLCANVERGDLVIAPTLTFIASINSIKYVGADPVFIDCELDNMGMSSAALTDFLEKNCFIDQDGLCRHFESKRRISAVMAVHILGMPVRIDAIVDVCTKYNLKLIEDASEALGSNFNKRHVGTFGDFGIFSFNGNKIISSGGGGILVAKDKDLLKRAKHLSTTAKVDSVKFIHDEIGFNYRMVNILAALGCAQLEQINYILNKRIEDLKYYRNLLAENPYFSLLDCPNDLQCNNWFFPLVIHESCPITKDEIVQKMIEQGIHVRPLWELMHKLSMFSNCEKGLTPNSEELHSKIITIPCSTGVSRQDIEMVVETLCLLSK